VTVQNRISFTYLYLDDTTGMTHLKIMSEVNSLSWLVASPYCHCHRCSHCHRWLHSQAKFIFSCQRHDKSPLCSRWKSTSNVN